MILAQVCRSKSSSEAKIRRFIGWIVSIMQWYNTGSNVWFKWLNVSFNAFSKVVFIIGLFWNIYKNKF